MSIAGIWLKLNPIRHGSECRLCCRSFGLLWEHQGSCVSEIFRELLKFIKVFGLIFFSYTLYLRDSGPFVRTFSETWKTVFTWSMFKFSQQKLNLLVIYYLFFCFQYNNDWLRTHKLHYCKQFLMTFGKQELLYV